MIRTNPELAEACQALMAFNQSHEPHESLLAAPNCARLVVVIFFAIEVADILLLDGRFIDEL
jgi:hypothetical protein